MVLWLTAVSVCRAAERGLVSWFLLFQMTPEFCGGVDGPEMYEILSGFACVCADGLMKGDGVSVLMGICVVCYICISCL